MIVGRLSLVRFKARSLIPMFLAFIDIIRCHPLEVNVLRKFGYFAPFSDPFSTPVQPQNLPDPGLRLSDVANKI
jgi:hypothetical protein